MKNKFKAITLLVILSFTATACTLADVPVIGGLFGGSDGGVGGGGPVTITWWGLWESEEVAQALIARYQEINPNVTVVYEDRSVLDLFSYKERVYARSAEGGGPDVMRIHNSWFSGMQSVGLLTPAPSSIVDAGAYREEFFSIASESALINGQVYGMPMYYDGLVLVYNKDHFEEIGQVEPPTAWEEFRRLAIELTVREDNEIVRAGAAMGSADNIEFFSDIIGMLWSQAGVNIPDEIDTKSGQDAIVFYTNFLTQDKVWRSDFPESVNSFVDGRVSMIMVPSWRVLDILEVIDDAQKVGVAPVPQARAEDPATWGTFWMEAVPATSQNPEVAWDFINFLAQEEQQLFKFNENSKSRFFGSPYSRVSLADELTSSPYLGASVRSAPYAKGVSTLSARAGNERQYNAMKDAVGRVLGGTNPVEALEEVKLQLSR